MEALLFFMVCSLLISILCSLASALPVIQKMEKKGYEDYEVQKLYESTGLHVD